MQSDFSYLGGRLFCEGVDVSKLASCYGTPSYVYSRAGIVGRFREYATALQGLPHRVCFAVKANSNLSVLSVLAGEGAGFDIVSGGELYRVLAAGGDPGTVVFSGVGKTEAEIRFALEKRIHSFNCESESEIEWISRAADSVGTTASIAVRVNPDVDAATHPYISTGLREHKFGVDIARAEEIYRWAAKLPGIAVEGVSCHIGSQLLNVSPMINAARLVFGLANRLRAGGLPIRNVDLGGGLGVAYQPRDQSVSVADFVQQLRPLLQSSGLTLMLEPGRSLVAEAGVLLSRVLLVKKNGDKTFVILDAGMNDLIRPALYHAYHEIVSVLQPSAERITADVVGPVCETGDFFARDREMPLLKEGDLVAIRTAGAYGFVLSSNYNSRLRPSELLVDGSRVRLARRRETYSDLILGEVCGTGDVHGIGDTDREDDRAARSICTEPA